jgi:hypothetical protein
MSSKVIKQFILIARISICPVVPARARLEMALASSGSQGPEIPLIFAGISEAAYAVKAIAARSAKGREIIFWSKSVWESS